MPKISNEQLGQYFRTKIIRAAKELRDARRKYRKAVKNTFGNYGQFKSSLDRMNWLEEKYSNLLEIYYDAINETVGKSSPNMDI